MPLSSEREREREPRDAGSESGPLTHAADGNVNLRAPSPWSLASLVFSFAGAA